MSEFFGCPECFRCTEYFGCPVRDRTVVKVGKLGVGLSSRLTKLGLGPSSRLTKMPAATKNDADAPITNFPCFLKIHQQNSKLINY